MKLQVGLSDCIPAPRPRQPDPPLRAPELTPHEPSPSPSSRAPTPEFLTDSLTPRLRVRKPLRALSIHLNNRPSSALALVLLALTACSVPHWPTEGPLTSGYGIRFRGLAPSIHHGVDVAVPEGTPIRAMKSGRVTHAGPLGSYGIAVILDHGGGWTTLYAHLSRADVATGTAIENQAIVGLSGSTGNATGPHLHFEVRRYGRTADPVPLLGGPPTGSR